MVAANLTCRHCGAAFTRYPHSGVVCRLCKRGRERARYAMGHRKKPAILEPLTMDRLRAALRHDQDTGFFYWIIRQGKAQAGAVAGAPTSRGYRHIRINWKTYQAHRLVWFYHHGEWPPLLDHINGHADDNRLPNLRVATLSQNAANSRLSKANTSGIKGASFIRRTGKWCAFIKQDGRTVNLGTFNTAEDAHAAYWAAAERVFGEFARRA